MNVIQATLAGPASNSSTASTGRAIELIELPATLAAWPVKYRRKSRYCHSDVRPAGETGSHGEDLTYPLGFPRTHGWRDRDCVIVLPGHPGHHGVHVRAAAPDTAVEEKHPPPHTKGGVTCLLAGR